MKKSTNALTTVEKAMAIDPKNPLCKFHRATILFSLERYQVTNNIFWKYNVDTGASPQSLLELRRRGPGGEGEGFVKSIGYIRFSSS